MTPLDNSLLLYAPVPLFASGDGYLQEVDVPSGADLPGGGSDEGRAMLQIVHDVAPDAKLYFRTGFISEYNMAARIDELANIADIDIIVDDLTYLKEPYYKDGYIAQAIEQAVQVKGKQFYTSAGNFGNLSYEATFSGVASSDGSVYRHQFDDDFLQKLTLKPGLYVIGLQYDNPYYSLGEGGASVDLDIYLTDAAGNKQYGYNWNNTGADPIELMYFRVKDRCRKIIVLWVDSIWMVLCLLRVAFHR